MVMASAQRNAAIAVTAAFTSGVLLYFGTGLHPVWWLTWFAVVPVLVAAAHLPGGWTFASAFTAWVMGALNMWTYFRVTIETPVIPTVIFIVAPAVLFAGIVLVYSRFLRISGWQAALIFPSLWVVYEFATVHISPHSTFGNISYSQMDFLPVLQLASITGIWGISFSLFLFAATVAVWLSANLTKGRRGPLATVVFLWFALVLGFGTWRLRVHSPAQNTVKVGLVASDLRQNLITDRHDDTMRLVGEYLEQVRALAVEGARVIVIPEKVAVLLDAELPEFDPLFLSAARQTGALIIVGVVHPTIGAKWNEARLYTPGGEIKTYGKHHMLPAFESKLTPGASRTEWDESSGRWGMQICKDMDFPQLSREYGNDGTALLLVPAWDFVSDGWLHGRMAILRGVESGFTIARAPKQGVLTVTDDTGRVIAERVTGSEPFTSLVAAAPVRHSATFYGRFGDWFAWLNVTIALWLLVYSAVQRSPQP